VVGERGEVWDGVVLGREGDAVNGCGREASKMMSGRRRSVMLLLVFVLVLLGRIKLMILSVELRNERIRVVGRKSWMLRRRRMNVVLVLMRRRSMMIPAERVGRGRRRRVMKMIRVRVRKGLPSLNRPWSFLPSSRVHRLRRRRIRSPTSRRPRLRRRINLLLISSSLLTETSESSFPRTELRESPKHRRRRGRSRSDPVPVRVQRLAERNESSSVLVNLILSRMRMMLMVISRDRDLSTVLLSLPPPHLFFFAVDVDVEMNESQRRSSAERRVSSKSRLMLDRSWHDALTEVGREVGVVEGRMLVELVRR